MNQAFEKNKDDSNISKKFLIIDENLIKKGVELGKGGNSTVYNSQYRKLQLAQKILNEKSKLIDNSLLKELDIIEKYKHRKVPRFIGICLSNNCFYINSLIYEKIDGATLADITSKIVELSLSRNVSKSVRELKENNYNSLNLNKRNYSYCTINKYKSFNDKNNEDVDNEEKNLCLKKYNISILLVFAELCDVLIDLHDSKIIHRDIKPSNIMIDKFQNCFLLDFGISIQSSHTQTNVDYGGTMIYMAPESIPKIGNYTTTTSNTNKSLISNKIDIWAIGCMLSEIYSGESPWRKENHFTIMSKLRDLANDTDYFKIPDDIRINHPNIYKIIERCLINDSSKRINIHILNYMILKEIYDDFSELYKTYKENSKFLYECSFFEYCYNNQYFCLFSNEYKERKCKKIIILRLFCFIENT